VIATSPLNHLQESGWNLAKSRLAEEVLDTLRDTVFDPRVAGTRCLLDHPLVQEAARLLIAPLIASGYLVEGAVAIQAIAFDKTAPTNWKVAWHQDLMFPFARKVTSEGFDLPSVKGGVDYARPPREVLEALLAARLHLDDCALSNGPLRISPGTHRLGILTGAQVADVVAEFGEVSCLAGRGDVLLMRPLALHASSQATKPGHRRVLHYVFHSGPPVAEPWHRAIGIKR
jgi:ectoine hydroxylase-related dioxygenase (phytanoyl-CoA dioxygenase family)